jgi:hypothetical protein
MPSVNVLRNVNLAVPTQGAGTIRRNSVPFSSVNYIFEEYQATGSAPIGGRLVMDLKNGQVFDITDNATGNFTVQPNTTVSSSLVSTLPWPYLGSFSMSLSISGSDFQYAASSSNSSSLLSAEFVAGENVNYYITSSIGYVGTCTTPWLNPTGSCGANLMKYSTLSLDDDNNKWYLTNAAGRYTPNTSSFGIITGSASVVNVNKNGCNYPGVQFSDFWNATGLAGLGLVYFYTRAITPLEVSNIYNDGYDRFFPPAPSVMGGRIFGEGLNG